MCQAIYLFIVSTAWELCVVVYHVVLTSHYNKKNCFNIFFCPPHICNRRLFVTPAHLKSKWFCCLYINVALRTPSFLFSLYFVCVSLAAIRNFARLDKYEHVIRRPINCPSTWGFYLSSTSNLRIYDEFVVFFVRCWIVCSRWTGQALFIHRVHHVGQHHHIFCQVRIQLVFFSFSLS